MAALQQVSFAVAVLLSSLITMSCFNPPNQIPRDGWNRDSLGYYASPTAARARRMVAVAIGIIHTLLVLGYGDLSLVCPEYENLNRQLFDWNLYTLSCLLMIICVGGPLRLMAFHQLGRNFTFRLGPPSTLTTAGIYRYIQHPGYTGQIIVLVVNLALFLRWDGALGCWLPHSMRLELSGWGFVWCLVILIAILRRLIMRVKDEEDMLRMTFGEKWVVWNRATKRFIPGVL